jgi:hypothetical protein
MYSGNKLTPRRFRSPALCLGALVSSLLCSFIAQAEEPVVADDAVELVAAAEVENQPKRRRGGPTTASAGPSGALAADAMAADAVLAADSMPVASPLPFSINASVGANANLGSMVRPNVQTTDSVMMNFGLGLSYSITDLMSVSASGSLSKFVTPHGSTRQYEARFGDVYLGFNHGNLYTIPVAEINISGGVSAALPTSDFSRFMSQYTSLGANLALSRTVGRFTFSYAFSTSKNFNRYTSVVFNPERFEADALVRGNGAENISDTRVAIATGILPEWNVSNSLRMAVRLPANFGAALGFTISDSFTYADDSLSADDELQSEYAVLGRGHSQTAVGSISASYRFLTRFSTNLSFSTAAPPKTNDNSRFRFPFWDTQSGNLQYTAVSLSLNVNY